jgi:hypothetical protein
VTDCPQCAILSEEIRRLRADLDRRDTVLPPRDTLPSPRPYLAEEELQRAFGDLDSCLPTDAQEGP